MKFDYRSQGELKLIASSGIFGPSGNHCTEELKEKTDFFESILRIQFGRFRRSFLLKKSKQ